MIKYITYNKDGKIHRKRVVIRTDLGLLWLTGYHYPIDVNSITANDYYLSREYFQAALKMYKKCVTEKEQQP